MFVWKCTVAVSLVIILVMVFYTISVQNNASNTNIELSIVGTGGVVAKKRFKQHVPKFMLDLYHNNRNYNGPDVVRSVIPKSSGFIPGNNEDPYENHHMLTFEVPRSSKNEIFLSAELKILTVNYNKVNKNLDRYVKITIFENTNGALLFLEKQRLHSKNNTWLSFNLTQPLNVLLQQKENTRHIKIVISFKSQVKDDFKLSLMPEVEDAEHDYPILLLSYNTSDTSTKNKIAKGYEYEYKENNDFYKVRDIRNTMNVIGEDYKENTYSENGNRIMNTNKANKEEDEGNSSDYFNKNGEIRRSLKEDEKNTYIDNKIMKMRSTFNEDKENAYSKENNDYHFNNIRNTRSALTENGKNINFEERSSNDFNKIRKMRSTFKENEETTNSKENNRDFFNKKKKMRKAFKSDEDNTYIEKKNVDHFNKFKKTNNAFKENESNTHLEIRNTNNAFKEDEEETHSQDNNGDHFNYIRKTKNAHKEDYKEHIAMKNAHFNQIKSIFEVDYEEEVKDYGYFNYDDVNDYFTKVRQTRSTFEEDYEEDTNVIWDDDNQRKNLGRKWKRLRNTCRRKPLYVDFSEINFDSWIVQPSGYEAYQCHGKCFYPVAEHLSPTKHAIVQAIVHNISPSRAARSCCVPTKLDPISVLYIDSKGVLTYRYAYKDMVVSECGCR